MTALQRFSEPYSATGGLAAIGVLNQLGRPDAEALEVLVREAVQNCWDAKRPDSPGIRVEIGRSTLDAENATRLKDTVLVDPPPALPLADEVRGGMQTLYVADFGTHGLAGPTRADRPGEPRDFVDFVRNIGQPPDKDFGGGSFGYGKAAFYIASAAKTVVIDTLCEVAPRKYERRLLGCALGGTFDLAGVPYTGRHWWGRISDGTPEPVTGDEADRIAGHLGLPPRVGSDGRGTTVLVVAPSVSIETVDGVDSTMEFIAESIAWNFWPRMIDTPGGARRTMEFSLSDCGKSVRIPNPRTHQRLRGFVEAMDRLRQEPGEDLDDLSMDCEIRSLRPVRRLGRLTIQKGPVAPADLPDRPLPRGARITSAGVHHVALMRTPELVVTYLAGATPVTGRLGYAGVFKCGLDADDMFKAAEPPTHDEWVYRSVHDKQWRSFVKIALERVQSQCRLAAGYDASIRQLTESDAIPLGEFADALAALMPGQDGPGARRPASQRVAKSRTRRRSPARRDIDVITDDVWVDAPPDGDVIRPNEKEESDTPQRDRIVTPRPLPPPQTRSGGDPVPVISADGSPVIAYPFELRTKGNRVCLSAAVEVMTNDGAFVESEPPVGYVPPAVHCWVDPLGSRHLTSEVVVGPEGVDGKWLVEIELRDEMMRVDLTVERR
ncbi:MULTISPECIES: hypothetical protein [unclassified Mycobacterium]|uniref:hypothetical protein n=1 Tax=unclassified Mycobacterium TaxID=2642494 RepID=UPI0029C7D211|nr:MULTISPECIES: hypothetical protein [unclassified Mycobacterium]